MHHPFAVIATALLASPVLVAQSLLEDLPVTREPLPPLGSVVAGLAAGDLDADGDDDVIASENNETVVLWQQNGVFTRQVAGTVLLQMTVADFDGDGALDVCSSLGRALWGNSTPLFPAATTTFSPPSGFNSNIEHGDYDHDGNLDLLLSPTGPNQVHGGILMRNLGNRTFVLAPPTTVYLSAPSGTGTAIFVDLDGDTYLDILQISRTATTRLYWNNLGIFTEATAAEFPLLQTSLRGWAIGDFDGDGDTDVVLGGDVDGGVLLRNDGPRLIAVVTGIGVPDRTVALHAADEDGDGDLDLLVLRSERNHVLHNDGTGHFTLSRQLGGCDELSVVTVADLDDDGDRDVLAAGRALFQPYTLAPRVMVADANATGPIEYRSKEHLPALTNTIGLRTGDIDGDGLQDLAMLGVGTAPLRFLTNDGCGGFAYREVPRTGSPTNGFFADLDGDGRDEYVQTGSLPGFLANVGGEPAATPTPLPVVGFTVDGVAADLDGDGDNELLMVRLQGQTVVAEILVRVAGVWQNETATRNPAAPIPFSTGSSSHVLPADLDGDGDLDLWFHTDQANQILINQGAGVFVVLPGAVPSSVAGGYFASINDLDGDGDLDLHAGRYVFLNNGDATFTDASANVPNVTGNDLLGRSYDVDDDGDVDLVGQGLVMWNDGQGSFSVATNVLPFSPSGNVGVTVCTDIDRDGDLDVVTSPYGAPPRVLTNRIRQAWLQGPALLGGALEFHITTRAGGTPAPTATWLACSFARMAPMQLDSMGWLQVDPGPSFFLGPQLLPAAGGDAVLLEPVPVDPSLQGRYFCAQTVDLRAGRIRLGNFMEKWLGD